jgi:hypothetical protein
MRSPRLWTKSIADCLPPDSAREKLLEVPEGLVRTALDLELAEGTVIANRVWVFRAD